MPCRPLITAIIPSFNSGRFVVQAVESVLAQTYGNVETIVVDDGSTDDTADRLAAYLGDIRYIRQPNGGLSRARNRGMEEARGEFFAFLDADDMWLPEKLLLQWECLADQPDAGLVHTDTCRLYESTGERVYVPGGAERFCGTCYTEFFWGHSVTPSTVMVSRQCIDEVGGFDESIRRPSTQDLDLWIRIARNCPLAYVDKPLVLYRYHATNSSYNLQMMVEDECYVLAKALNDDPGLWTLLGRGKARKRMFDLTFGAGYHSLVRRDLRKARGYFRNALAYSPTSLKGWGYWVSTFLPGWSRAAIRQVKRRLIQRSQHQPGMSVDSSPGQPRRPDYWPRTGLTTHAHSAGGKELT
jgi:glycosyltransferase involved in cell wall biosynthesis